MILRAFAMNMASMARIAACGAMVVSLLLVAAEIPGTPDHPLQGTLHIGDAHGGGLPAALMLQQASGGVPGAVLGVEVVVDEEFVDRVGPGWEGTVQLMLDDANRLLGEIDLRLETVSVGTWVSSDSEDSLGALLAAADRNTERAAGRLLLAITCQDTVTYDGWVHRDRGEIGVHFYHEDHSHTSSVIVHEIAHLLGAAHHGEEEECDDDECLMERAGYVRAVGWCDHHRGELRDAVAAATQPA